MAPEAPQSSHIHLVAPPRYSHVDDPVRLSSDMRQGSSRKDPRMARYALTTLVAVLSLVVVALAIAG